MLDFRIYTFLEVCKYMNFTKAADSLHITQPAVSQHIRFIENYYDTKLFTFHGKKTVLTKAGEYLYHAASTLSHDQIYLKEALSSIQNHPSLIFGVTLTIGEFIMPNYMISYQKNHPDISMTMIVSNTHELLQKISSGEIDFALIEGYFDKSQYDYLTFSTEPYIAVCGKDFSGSVPTDSIQSLLPHRLIVREAGSGTREILEKYLDGKNLSIHDFSGITEIGNIHALKALVKANLGITFLYKAAAEEELEAGTFVDITPKDFCITHDFTMIWQKGSLFSSRYESIFKEWKNKSNKRMK